jgi:hypothetical protein
VPAAALEGEREVDRPAAAQKEIAEVSSPMKQIHFFATRTDLLSVTDLVEQQLPIKYVLAGNFASPNSDTYLSATDIPSFGRASVESSIGCDTFLVCARELPIEARPFDLYSGERRYAFDQLCNGDTVTFTAGGIWKPDVLLNGRVATVSDSAPAQLLMRRFHLAMKKRFVKIKAFHVGPEAVVMLDSGKRLAGAEQSPRELDLAR